MKFIFDANPLAQNKKSGIGYYNQMLISALSLESPEDTFVGHYFNFLGQKKPQFLPRAKNISYAQSKLFPTKLINLGRRFGIQLPLEFFTRQKADITIFTNFVASPTLTKTKKVSLIYDLSYIDCPEFVSDNLTAHLTKWVPYTLRASDLIVVNCEFVKSRIIDFYSYPSDKIVIVPIPPAEHYKPDYSIISKHKLDKSYVLFVGTIEPRKNIINLIKGYSRIEPNLRNKYPLVLAGGKGWKDSESLLLIEELQKKGVKIILTGYISDGEKAALYKNASVCIQPSLYEGFGMPILEAMSYGKPVVCSNLAVFHEVAADAAIYFDAKNPDDIANCLSNVIANPDLQMSLSIKSTKYMKKYPKWEQVAKELYSVFKKL